MLEKHLTGRLVKLLEKTELPEDEDIIKITCGDLNQKTVSFFDSHREVMGDSDLAVFGNDMESVEDYINSLDVIEPDDSEETIKEDENLQVDSYSYKSGNVAYYFRKPQMTVSSQFVIHRHRSSPLNDLRVRVWQREGFFHIETSTQWPMQVRRSVAKELGIEVEKVILHSVHYHDRYDEYLYDPTSAAIIAAIAAKKSGLPADLIITPTAFHPEVKIDIISAIDKNGKCRAVKAEAAVDLGKHPGLGKEYLTELTCGLIPVYRLSAIEINAKAYRSDNPPAGFFSDLGYSTGLAAIENHFSKLAHKLDIYPTDWRTENIFKSPLSEPFRKSSQFAVLKNTLQQSMQASRFERQFSVGSHGISPFISYARGIGVSCGEGIQGFSNSFEALNDYFITVSVSEDRKMSIACGIIPDAFLADIIKKTVREKFGDEITEVKFAENTGTDFGPSVLGRKIKYIPSFVEKCCEQLAGKDFPCSVTYSAYKENNDCLYEADTCASLIMSLHIDPVMLVPVVDHIFCSVGFGEIFDRARIQRMIRQVISSTISEICPESKNSFDINLTVEDNDHFPAGSASSLIRGLTIASFTSALSQALDHDLKKLPVQDNDILGIIGLKNEDQLHN